MKYCGHCGAQMNDDADVCVRCHVPCDQDVYGNQQADKKEGNKMAVITVVFLLLVLLCVACYYFVEISFYNNLLNF